jgi:ferredoxin
MSGQPKQIPVVDRERCVGSTSCIQIAPGVYDMGEDGYSEVIDPAGADEATVQRAIDYCPAQALRWA